MKRTFHGVACLLLLAGVALCQTTTPAPTLKPRSAESNELVPDNGVSADTPVITVQGLCERPANSSAMPADCKTVITRAQFEKLTNSLQPNMPPAQKKQLATRYVQVLLLAEKAHEQGLDQGPEFDEQMYLQRLQILARDAQMKMQKDATNISDSEINDYYQQHAADYKTISFERIYVPAQKQTAAADDKPTDPDVQKKREASQPEMKAEADKLRERAAAGEDFAKLQQEAYDFADNKMKATNVKMENMRKASIPLSDASIFDLKKDEVSQPFSDVSGYRIYKIQEIKDLPLAGVREEILRTLQSEKMKNSMDSLQNSAKPTYDDAYFATPSAPSLKKPGEAPVPQGTTPPPPGKK